MRIDRGVTSVKFALSFDELLFGECYKCEQSADGLYLCAFLPCGEGRGQTKLKKVVCLISGQIYNINQVRTWRFHLANASVSV